MMEYGAKYNRWSLFLLSLVATLLLLLSSVQSLGAHSDQGTIVLDQMPVGSYKLTTQISPEVIRSGEVHFAAMVTADGMPMLDCDVFIEVTSLEHKSSVLFAQMRPADVSHRFWHEIELTLADEGSYEVRITVQDKAGNGGQASFEIEAQPSSTWMIVLIYSQLTMAPLIGFWLIKEAIGVWLRL